MPPRLTNAELTDGTRSILEIARREGIEIAAYAAGRVLLGTWGCT
ncbi:MAG: hypothetical protein AB1716_20195 [Planctomycetota bacterium]